MYEHDDEYNRSEQEAGNTIGNIGAYAEVKANISAAMNELTGVVDTNMTALQAPDTTVVRTQGEGTCAAEPVLPKGPPESTDDFPRHLGRLLRVVIEHGSTLSIIITIITY